jgi:hypothetical protein
VIRSECSLDAFEQVGERRAETAGEPDKCPKSRLSIPALQESDLSAVKPARIT